MKMHFKRKILPVCLAALVSSFSNHVLAADFNLPFVTGGGLGDLYAGWAASATDASTAYTNPAGLVKLKNQQLVFSGLGVSGSSQFSGTTTNAILPFLPAQTGVASTKLRGIMPTLYYAAPAYKNVVFAFNASAPFALGTNYSKDSILRYVATRSQIAVLDIGPSVGIKINEQFSVGLGFDANRATLTLNQMYGPPLSSPDAEGQNHLAGWGYGWHGGVLYQPLPSTRVGLSFNSMVVVHMTGDSEAFMPTGMEFRTTRQNASVVLPARTQLSIDQKINPKLNVMATLFYTNWSSLNQVTLNQTMTPGGAAIPVVIPFEYHNTFDYALGMTYQLTDKWLLRTGGLLLTKPSNDRDRSVVDPIGGAVILGLGAHYQQNATLGYDLSYAHGFFQNANINFRSVLATATGHSSANTNILGAQVTWNIA
jgi:long-chain fatty acid transport protein